MNICFFNYIKQTRCFQGLFDCCDFYFYRVAYTLPFFAVSPIKYTEGMRNTPPKTKNRTSFSRRFIPAAFLLPENGKEV